MADQPRRLVLRNPWLRVDGNKVTLEGHSSTGRPVEVRIEGFDADNAACVVRTLSRFIADDIEKQKQRHCYLRENLRRGWARVNDAIKQGGPDA